MKAKVSNLCSVMERKRITNPNSQRGIKCCLNCKLEVCELETEKDKRKLPGGIIFVRTLRARQLAKGGLTPKEIAKELRVGVRTVWRYLA